MGSECLKDCTGLIEQLPCRLDIAGAPPQFRACDHRFGEIVPRADVFEDPNCGFDTLLGGSRRLGRQTFGQQPTSAALQMETACRPAGREHVIDQGPSTGAIASAKMALGKPNCSDDMSPAHVCALKPGQRLAQFSDSVVDLTRLDLPVPADHGRPRGIARDWCERQRLVAAFQSALDVALLNMGRSQPGPANRLEPEILEGVAVLEATPTIVHARFPIAEIISGSGQMPERPAGPPA